MQYKVIKQFLGGPELGRTIDSKIAAIFHQDVALQFLIDGGYIEEVEGKWKPDVGHGYSYIDEFGRVKACVRSDVNDDRRIEFGNYFETPNKALKARDAIKELLKTI